MFVRNLQTRVSFLKVLDQRDSKTKGRLAGGDQTLNGMKLIGEATLNVLQARGRREIIAVEEKRSHVSHEHMSFKQEVVRLCQLGIGK
jgi:hypothetical protein